MKRNHRRWHRLTWALLLPAVVAALVLAWSAVPADAPNPAWPASLPEAKP